MWRGHVVKPAGTPVLAVPQPGAGVREHAPINTTVTCEYQTSGDYSLCVVDLTQTKGWIYTLDLVCDPAKRAVHNPATDSRQSSSRR